MSLRLRLAAFYSSFCAWLVAFPVAESKAVQYDSLEYSKRLGMTAFTFDAIEHLKRLKQDGFTEAQAESVIKIARDVQETNLSFIATKADIERLDSKFDTVAERLDRKIDSIKAELKADIRELELRMHNKIAQGTITIVKWIAAVLVLQVLSPLVQSILPLLKAH